MSKIYFKHAEDYMLKEYNQEKLKSIASNDSQFKHKLLRQCVTKGSVADFKRLVDAGFNINQPNQFGITMLMMATQYNRVDMVKALLKAGAKVNPQDMEGNTALIRASRSGYTEITSLLLSVKEIDINLCNHAGLTAVRHALQNDKTETADLLIKAGADVKKFQPQVIQNTKQSTQPLLKKLFNYFKQKETQHCQN